MVNNDMEAVARTAPITEWMRALLQVVGDEGIPAGKAGLAPNETRRWCDLASIPYILHLDRLVASEDIEPLHFAYWLARKSGLIRRSTDSWRVTRKGKAFGNDPVADVLDLIGTFAGSLGWAKRRRPGESGTFCDKRVDELTPNLLRRMAAGPKTIPTADLVDEALAILRKHWIIRDIEGPRSPRLLLTRSIEEGFLEPLAWLGVVRVRQKPGPQIVAATRTWLLREHLSRIDDKSQERQVLPVSLAMNAPSAEELLDACVKARLAPAELAEAARAFRDVHGSAATTDLIALFETAEERLYTLHHLAAALPWEETFKAILALAGRGLGLIGIEAIRPLANQNSTDFVGYAAPPELTMWVSVWKALGAAAAGRRREGVRIIAAAPYPDGAVAMLGASPHPKAKPLLRAIADNDPLLACAALEQLYPHPTPLRPV
ncbi:MAG TPA: hypothetical protein VGB64_09315 [Actinomycetota bacterium]